MVTNLPVLYDFCVSEKTLIGACSVIVQLHRLIVYSSSQVTTLRATHLVHVALQAPDELLVVDGVLLPHLGQPLPHPDMTSCLVTLRHEVRNNGGIE